ncbi:hypothetical protein [Microbacterium radiodurans]|uniref:hypothetical protein n=1 Tax=Microbacterium radiodurans TaxID=661398 RepID=UPI00123DE7D2|nr:hypothetical protein [Microbacterium radiodurans]
MTSNGRDAGGASGDLASPHASHVLQLAGVRERKHAVDVEETRALAAVGGQRASFLIEPDGSQLTLIGEQALGDPPLPPVATQAADAGVAFRNRVMASRMRDLIVPSG